MDIKTLKELVRLMVDNDLSEVDLRDQEETVTLKRPGPQAPVMMAQPMQHAPAPAPAPAQAPSPTPAPATPAPSADDGLLAVESPMVGTFYSKPDPDSPSYVNAGKQIRKDDVVCVIEAMKVFNEIKSEVAGVIERILVEDGQPVEYGQKLFLVRPA
ncbi:MAG: acetyl-CoA carboxylase biotin carboxyl carrier protein [Phycisphaerales bacterium]|nr:MAG: acetyl-CoA carboxylase biotin carboxyl carrier protein [Phycisphaerales bacterium]